jgi:gliding motility-associated lipoprotein GldH
MKMKLQLFFIGLLLVILASCDNKRVFEKYEPIAKTGWNKDSLVVFTIPVTDTLQNHNLYVDVRNDVSYSYSNLWLFIEIDQPGGEALKDTFQLSLADPTGKWLGKGWGGKKTVQVMYRRDVYFPVSGMYKIKLQQGMRETNLKGISNIGIRVEKTGS